MDNIIFPIVRSITRRSDRIHPGDYLPIEKPTRRRIKLNIILIVGNVVLLLIYIGTNR